MELNAQEEEDIEEDDDKYAWLKGLAALLTFIAVVGFICYQVGKSHGSDPVKIIDNAASEIMYNPNGVNLRKTRSRGICRLIV